MPTSRRVWLIVLGVVFASGPNSSNYHAQPTGDKAPVDAVFVIDASMTMGVRDGRHTRLQQAQAEALAILDKLPPGSTAQVIVAADQVGRVANPAYRLEDARGLIHDIELTSLSCDLVPALQSAREAAQRGANKAKSLYLFTDLREASWKHDANSVRKELSAWSDVHIVRCGGFTPHNVAVLDIVPAGQIALPDRRASYAVVIANTGQTPVRNLQVDLLVDGDAKNAEALPIASLRPGETRSLVLTAKMSAGTHVLTAIVKHDDLDGDNRLNRVVRVPERVNILIVDGGFDAIEPEKSSSFALRHALLPVKDSDIANHPNQVRVVAPARATPVLLNETDICIFVNAAVQPEVGKQAESVSAEFLDELARFVRAGKGLMIFAGDNVAPEPYNRILGARHGLLPAKIRGVETSDPKEPFALARNTFDHPAFLRFKTDKVYESFDALPFWRTLDLEAPAPADSASAIVRYENGRPAVVRRRVGAGEVLLVAMAADLGGVDPKTRTPKWTIWHKLPNFLYFVDACVSHLHHAQADVQNVVAGQTWSLPMKRADSAHAFSLLTPTGAWLRLGRPELERDVPTLRGPALPRAGVYRLVRNDVLRDREGKTPDQLGIPIAVASDPRASADIAYFNAKEFDRWLGYPVKHSEARIEAPPQPQEGIALLLDASRSMSQHDERIALDDRVRAGIALGLVPPDTKGDKRPIRLPKELTRADVLRGVLSNKDLQLVDALRKQGPVRLYHFGDHLRPGTLENYKAEDRKTGLADAIHELLHKKNPPRAIVVMTDGHDNASRVKLAEVADECGRRKVPLHTYGIHAAQRPGFKLLDLAAPDVFIEGDEAAVALHWRVQGFDAAALAKGRVEFTLELNGREVVRRDVILTNGADLRESIRFTVPKFEKPPASGEFKASVSVRVGEKIDKDFLTRAARVSAAKLRVLVIEHAPRWEWKYLQQVLLRDRGVEADFILVGADPQVAKSGPPYLEEFPKTREAFLARKYHLVVLGDVDAGYFTKDQQAWLREFVVNGGGLIALAGRARMPNSYENTPIAEMLPIEFRPQKGDFDLYLRTDASAPTLTVAGRRASWLVLADTPADNAALWRDKLPGFHGFFPVTKLRPGAVTLLAHARATIADQPMPILAAHTFGKGQVLWLGSDETWRWRYNSGDQIHARFWRQSVRQFGTPSLLGAAAPRAALMLDPSRAFAGDENMLIVRLLDKEFKPRNEPTIDAELFCHEAAPGKPQAIKLSAIAGRPGEYAALIVHERVGRWELRVEQHALPFYVDLPAGHELLEAESAEPLLRDAARRSGGHFYREEDLHRLVERIKAK